MRPLLFPFPFLAQIQVWFFVSGLSALPLPEAFGQMARGFRKAYSNPARERLAKTPPIDLIRELLAWQSRGIVAANFAART